MSEMRMLLIAASTVVGCALVFAGSMDINRVSGRSGLTMPVEITFSKAYARDIEEYQIGYSFECIGVEQIRVACSAR